MQRLPHNRSAVMMLEPSRVDGRRLRSERTRLAIIEAYLDLLREGPRMPTAARIARQVGCSVRSIFERFSDLNAFSLATADYAIAQGQAEAVARSVDGDRPARIQSHVETRARVCEKWGPRWRFRSFPSGIRRTGSYRSRQRWGRRLGTCF
jgi:AcrR family transcriptional regulator